jgi:hypothetical protein
MLSGLADDTLEKWKNGDSGVGQVDYFAVGQESYIFKSDEICFVEIPPVVPSIYILK